MFVFLAMFLLPLALGVYLIGPSTVMEFMAPVVAQLARRADVPPSLASPISPAAAPAPERPAPAAPAPAAKLTAADWDTADGHFFTQTNGQTPLASPVGFLVSNDGGARFWEEYQRLGGRLYLGYPVSARFTWRGLTVQVFQRGVLQDGPGEGQLGLVNIMDELTAQGKDDWLLEHRFIPRPLPASYGSPGDPIAARLALLAPDQEIANRYRSAPDSFVLFGLPTSRVTDLGAYVLSLRTQRGALHHWKTDGPWGRAGSVTLANAGEIALEVGLFPNAATTPEAAPSTQ